jgi:glycosyltransferase involved in cell wall biosynthesis
MSRADAASKNVTILIPTYGRPHLLGDAVRSALAQTHPDLHVLILDDASPDHTPAVAAAFAGHPNVSYHRQPKNLGLAANWRDGISRVRTPYFCILNDDDRLDPAFLEKMVAHLEAQPEAILATSDHWMSRANHEPDLALSDATSRHWKRDRLREGLIPNFARHALIDQSFFIGTTLFRADRVPPDFIDLDAGGAADIWLFYRCAATGCPAYYSPERLSTYALHDDGMSQSRAHRPYLLRGLIYLYETLLSNPAMADLKAEIPPRMARAANTCAIALLASGDCRGARELLARTLPVAPNLRAKIIACLAEYGAAGTRAANLAQSLRTFALSPAAPTPFRFERSARP